MAALMRHGVLRMVQIPQTSTARQIVSTAQKVKNADKRKPPRIDSTAQSIAARGFLRPQEPYTPPKDLKLRLTSVFEKVVGKADLDCAIGDVALKFELCSACAKEFDRCIPNSMLHTVETLGDVVKFYETPVDTRTPLDRMREMDLPENLHVQYEYHRFHPDTDTMFKGQTAFNRSSTLVTGLKYKGKYKGHNQNTEWPFNS